MPGTYLATQDGVPVSSTNGLPTTVTGTGGVVEVVPAGQGDGLTTKIALAVHSQNRLMNGASWDWQRNNTQGTILASAARTTNGTSPDQTNYNAKGVILNLDVTVASGTGGLQLRFQFKDPVSGNYVNLNVAPTAITAVGTYAYELYPGSSTAGTAGSLLVNQRTSGALPRTWRAVVQVGDASSYTYSIGYGHII